MAESILRKAARLQKVEHLLYRNPRGLTTRELARHCGVTQRTIQRDLLDLEERGVPLWGGEADGRHGILGGYYVPPVHFDLPEACALYLAARLLARYSDEHNPLFAQALAKLAGVMPEAVAAHIHNTIRALAYRPDNEAVARVLVTVLEGWAAGRKVHIAYQTGERDEAHETLLSPYFLEPSIVGYATYVIGHSQAHGEARTFKVERICRARLTEETFDLPEGFDGAELLRNAWGVMYGPAGEEVEVVLRFSPQVARRVRESVWHPSQVLEGCADGGCVLRVRVAMVLEMKPFIRSWGPDCAVLAPQGLRDEIAEEMRRAAEGYAADG